MWLNQGKACPSEALAEEGGENMAIVIENVRQETTAARSVKQADENRTDKYLQTWVAPVTTGIWQSPEAQARQRSEQEAYAREHRGERRAPVIKYGEEEPDMRLI